MTKVICRAVVLFDDNVVLVRKTKSDEAVARWRLPERELRPEEAMLDCVSRSVLIETGYEVSDTHLLNISSLPQSEFGEATLKLLFGCVVKPSPVGKPAHTTGVFTSDEIIKLDAAKVFKDHYLLDIIFKYKAGLRAKNELLHGHKP